MHIEEATRVIGFIVIVALVIGLCMAIAFAAPSIRDASVAVMNIKAAPELAKATVDAAQYALQAKKDADKVALLEKEKAIENGTLLAKAEADRKIQDGLTQREDVQSKNALYAQVVAAAVILLVVGLSIFGLRAFSKERASHTALALTAQKQESDYMLLQDQQTKNWEIRKMEVQVVDKMVDAAIQKGFAITTPSGHTFTPPRLEASNVRDSFNDLAHQQSILVDNLSVREEKING
jgi:hypothetical protein